MSICRIRRHFLLGRTDSTATDTKQPISQQALPAFHGRPVWSASYGWLLVNAADRQLTFPDGHALPFGDAGELFITPPPFSEAEPPREPPLSRSDVRNLKEIWLEPISPDSDLRKELQGWYHVKGRFVENEYGNRFYLDTYGSKLLLLKNCRTRRSPPTLASMTALRKCAAPSALPGRISEKQKRGRKWRG